MAELCKTLPVADVIRTMADRWHIELTEAQVCGFKRGRDIHNGLVGGRFEQGHVPHNKGMHWKDYMSPEGEAKLRAQLFKPGERHGVSEANYRQVGAKRIDSKDGYVLVKVSDRPPTWEMRSRLVWEQANGPIPDGYIVIHLDGEPTNDDIDNLAIAPRRLAITVNKRGIKYADRETFETALLCAEVARAASKSEKRLKGVLDQESKHEAS